MKALSQVIEFLLLGALLFFIAVFIMHYALPVLFHINISKSTPLPPEITLCHHVLSIYVPKYTGKITIEQIIESTGPTIYVYKTLEPGQYYNYTFLDEPEKVTVIVDISGNTKAIVVENQCAR